mgnify:CR=1 FL=1
MAADTPLPLSAPPDGSGAWLRALQARLAAGEHAEAATDRAARAARRRADPAGAGRSGPPDH